jgi:hypothetical protein
MKILSQDTRCPSSKIRTENLHNTSQKRYRMSELCLFLYFYRGPTGIKLMRMRVCTRTCIRLNRVKKVVSCPLALVAEV